jgi:hypothetical protein
VFVKDLCSVILVIVEPGSIREDVWEKTDVPSAPHTVQHPTDALSGIGTIYEAK